MVLGIKPYRVYMDENGYRYSCRVRGCTDGNGSWELRSVAATEAKKHYDEKHTVRDEGHEKWIENLCEDGPVRVPDGGTSIQ
jgi:hypothetical protein